MLKIDKRISKEQLLDFDSFSKLVNKQEMYFVGDYYLYRKDIKDLQEIVLRGEGLYDEYINRIDKEIREQKIKEGKPVCECEKEKMYIENGVYYRDYCDLCNDIMVETKLSFTPKKKFRKVIKETLKAKIRRWIGWHGIDHNLKYVFNKPKFIYKIGDFYKYYDAFLNSILDCKKIKQ